MFAYTGHYKFEIFLRSPHWVELQMKCVEIQESKQTQVQVETLKKNHVRHHLGSTWLPIFEIHLELYLKRNQDVSPHRSHIRCQENPFNCLKTLDINFGHF